MDRAGIRTKDFQQQYKKTGRNSISRKNNDQRKATAQKSRNNRAQAFASNRNMEPETPEQAITQEVKKLPYNERFKIWKREKEEKKKLEEQNKKKLRPVFKVGGSVPPTKAPPISTIKKPSTVPPMPTNNANNNKRSNNNVNKKPAQNSNTQKSETLKQNTPKTTLAKSRRSNKINEQSELVVTMEKLSVAKEEAQNVLDSTFTKPADNRVSEDLDETIICNQISVVNERNEIIYITPSSRVTRSRKQNGDDEKKLETKAVLEFKTPRLTRKTPVKQRTPANSEYNYKTPESKNGFNILNNTGELPAERIYPKILLARNLNIETASTSDLKTPKKENEVAEYVSPFVTTSRGKNSAKKERISRRSLLTYAEDDSPQHRRIQSDYYRKVLGNEISRLMCLHDEWEEYKQENLEILTEDSIDMIDMALGQTKLLIRSKFEQFRGLIKQCETGITNDGQKVTATDLGAFWDMIFIQVENINTRYNKLTKLRENNWVEFVEAVVKNKKTKKVTRPVLVKTARGSSRMKDIIKAGRKKQQSSNRSRNASPAFYQISSPKMKIHNANKSLLSNVLKSQTKNRKMSCSRNQDDTPSKGILKTPGLNKSLMGKAVLFRNSDCNEVLDFDETLPVEQVRSGNDVIVRESINLISWDSPDMDQTLLCSSTPRNTRQSIRLNKGVLS